MPIAQSGPFSVYMPGQETSEQAVQSILDNRLNQQKQNLAGQEMASLNRLREQQIFSSKLKTAGDLALVDPDAAKRLVESDPVLKDRLGSIGIKRTPIGTEVTTQSGLKLVHNGTSWTIMKPESQLVGARRGLLEAQTGLAGARQQTERARQAKLGREVGEGGVRERDILSMRNSIETGARREALDEVKLLYPKAQWVVGPDGELDVAATLAQLQQGNPKAFRHYRRRNQELRRQKLAGLGAPATARIQAGWEGGEDIGAPPAEAVGQRIRNLQTGEVYRRVDPEAPMPPGYEVLD